MRQFSEYQRFAMYFTTAETAVAGACFSPDGSTMFVNIQNPGITFAIWGPWSDNLG